MVLWIFLSCNDARTMHATLARVRQPSELDHTSGMARIVAHRGWQTLATRGNHCSGLDAGP
eukprot:850233-Alexandrium_andersonii.AAC.1